MLSAVLATIGRPEYFDKALASILKQDEPFSEIVVFDNSRSQDVKEGSKFREHKAIRWERSGQHLPMVQSLNEAVRRSTCDYAILIGDDDIALPNLSRDVRRALRDVRLVYVPFRKIGPKGNPIAFAGHIEGSYVSDVFRWQRMTGKFELVIPGIAFSRTDFLSIGGFRGNALPSMAHLDDDLWFRMAAIAGTVRSTDNVGWHYRVHPGQPTADYKLSGVGQACENFARDLELELVRLGIEPQRIFPSHLSAARYGRVLAEGRIMNLMLRLGISPWRNIKARLRLARAGLQEGLSAYTLLKVYYRALRHSAKSTKYYAQ